jgi:hypothetical protein
MALLESSGKSLHLCILKSDVFRKSMAMGVGATPKNVTHPNYNPDEYDGYEIMNLLAPQPQS